jgi:ABC-type oligopeptide transport system substrate-binding subunit
MKKVLFIAALVCLASCSNETSTSNTDTLKCADSTCSDSTNVDSLCEASEAHVDSMNALLKKIKK